MTVRLKAVEEQVVVITGASSGIGLAAARLFAARRVRGLVLVSRNAETLRQVADELGARGTQAVAAPADTSRKEDLERVARVAVETFGGFDTWVNDAAVALYGPVERMPLEDQRRLFDVNYWGVVNGSLVAAQHLRRRGGAIINLGSVLSDRAMLLQTQYSASKHAVKGFTDGLRMELEEEGAPISVTLIKPSGVDTPYPEHARSYLGGNPRLPPPVYDPRLVARAIVFAAETPRRELTVGFGGWLMAALAAVAPRLVDRLMERAGRAAQTTFHPERPRMRDNLYRPRQDGDEYSSLPGKPRRTSYFLAAQMHPLAAAAIVAGLGAALAVLLAPTKAYGRRVRHARHRAASMAPRREGAAAAQVRHLGNGDAPRTVGPGFRTAQELREGRPQIRH
jgi:short-subunit dehydrogenase